MAEEQTGDPKAPSRESVLLAGRVAIVYALSTNYLFLPFVALCLAANFFERAQISPLSAATTPFVLLICAAIGGNQLRAFYDARNPDDPPDIWARRFTLMSTVSGAIWGLGAVVWFVPGAFPAQAYLVLAFLGMSAIEFIIRAAYPPAYLAHASASLLPLAGMLVVQGGPYQLMSAILLILFTGVLYNYSGTLAHYLDESIFLRHDNMRLIARLGDEKLVAENARDTAEANEQAKLAFISNISHELRTPLNAILGMVQMLDRSDLEKAQRDHVKVLLESTRGLQTLLDDIIALARHPNALEVPENGCDAAQTVRTVTRLLQPNAWEKRLRLSISVAQGLPRVAADPRLLRRVLLKLAGNAIKFTDRGTVEIALDTTADPSGRAMVRFAITDSGPGIPGDLRAALFEPFAPEPARAARGAGIGLAVAKRLIESVGGTIGVESEPGMGASFWITMPALSAVPREERAEADISPPPVGLSLLLFLPDDTTREAIARMLTPFGNRVTYADTLAQAVAVCARGGFTAIIAPTRHIDALAVAPGQRTPLLALSAQGERQPAAAGAVLQWPSGSSGLYAAIRAAIGESTAQPSDAQAPDGVAIDIKAFAELEKSLGFTTLIDILQSYLVTTEALANALTAASSQKDWVQAGRLAQDFAGAAGGLGLSALTTAARSLAQTTRDGGRTNALSAAASGVLAEHQRVREALRRLYPNLAA